MLLEVPFSRKKRTRKTNRVSFSSRSIFCPLFRGSGPPLFAPRIKEMYPFTFAPRNSSKSFVGRGLFSPQKRIGIEAKKEEDSHGGCGIAEMEKFPSKIWRACAVSFFSLEKFNSVTAFQNRFYGLRFCPAIRSTGAETNVGKRFNVEFLRLCSAQILGTILCQLRRSAYKRGNFSITRKVQR